MQYYTALNRGIEETLGAPFERNAVTVPKAKLAIPHLSIERSICTGTHAQAERNVAMSCLTKHMCSPTASDEFHEFLSTPNFWGPTRRPSNRKNAPPPPVPVQ